MRTSVRFLCITPLLLAASAGVLRGDDHLVELITTEVRVDELGRSAELQVQRSGPSLFQGRIEIEYDVIPESATAGEDFILASGSFSFHGIYGPHEPPPMVYRIRVQINDDAIQESTESFRVVLANLRAIGVSGSVRLGQTSARVIIEDNDGPEGPGLGADGLVTVGTTQSDGRILIGGSFHTVNGTRRTALARLLSDLSLDPTFDSGSGPAPGPRNMATIAPCQDGTILVGGSFGSFNGMPRQCIVRLKSDGAVDGALDVGTVVPSGDYHQAIVRNLVPLADGRFIAGGAFRSFGGVERPWVARFEATGVVDREFYAELPVPCREAASVVLQPDGKLLVLAVRGDGVFILQRLLPEGARDPEFNLGSPVAFGVMWPANVAVFPDGQILVQEYYRLTRISRDGLVLTEIDTPFSAILWSISMPDHRILVYGTFPNFLSTRYALARLFPDGAIDLSFQPQVSELAGALSLDAGNLLLLGDLFQVNSIPRSGYALIQSDGDIAGGVRLLAEKLQSGDRFRLSSADVSSLSWVLERSADLNRWTPIFTNTPGARLDLVLPESAPHGFYRVAQ
jgi:uncharacterized delta-60 repeat protein